MEFLKDYSSSSSEAEEKFNQTDSDSLTHLASSRTPASTPTRAPPPPDALEAMDIGSDSRIRREAIPVSLPAVTPVQEKVDSYLVHVFLPLVHPDLPPFARGLLAKARLAMVGKSIKAALTPITDFHVSISRPAEIRSAQIPLLVNQLRKAVSEYTSSSVVLRKKPVTFHSKNQRRLFIAAPVVTGASEQDGFALALIQLVSNIFQKHGLPRFFEYPRPHASFAWTETVDVSSVFSRANFENSNEDRLIVPVENVVCTVGKSTYTFPLKVDKHDSSKLRQKS